MALRLKDFSIIKNAWRRSSFRGRTGEIDEKHTFADLCGRTFRLLYLQ